MNTDKHDHFASQDGGISPAVRAAVDEIRRVEPEAAGVDRVIVRALGIPALGAAPAADVPPEVTAANDSVGPFGHSRQSPWNQMTHWIGHVAMRQRFAIGCVGVAALLGFLLLWGGIKTKPVSAMEQMAQNIRKAKSYTSTVSVWMTQDHPEPGEPAVKESKQVIYWLAPGSSRNEITLSESSLQPLAAITLPTMEATKPVEADLVNLLRVIAENNKGTFPPEIWGNKEYMQATQAAMQPELEKLAKSPAAQKLIEKFKSDKDEAGFTKAWMKMCEPLTQKITQKHIQGLNFYLGLKPENDAIYTGKGVKLGTPDRPILWYKPSGTDKYRVIYADLRVKELTPDDLQKLPALGPNSRAGKGSGHVINIRPAGKPGICINHWTKTFSRYPVSHHDQLNFLDELRKYPGEAKRELGIREINGKKARGFQIDVKNMEPEDSDPGFEEPGVAEIWLDTASNLPVFVRCVGTRGVDYSSILEFRDFQWNIDLDPKLFDTTPPNGYADQTPKPLALEEQVARITAALKVYAELTGGHYPHATSGFADGAGVCKRLGLAKWPDMSETKGNAGKAATIIKGFHEIAGLRDYRPEFAAYGKTVGPKDKDKVLLRWKLDDGRYEVIFGDLHSETVAAERLHDLERK
jgi:hypothetical protein